MIAKCVALLAVVAQINCYTVTSNCATPVIASGCGTGVVGTAGVVGTTGVVGTAGVGAVSRNIVAKGRYPVALSHTGPVPDSRIPVTTSHVQSPVQEKPTVRLPARIPVPRTVAHSCTCYKQILRPRVHDQYITVPTIQRYIETTHKPVVENIHYEAVPVNDATACASSVAATPVVASSVAAPVVASSVAAPVVAVADNVGCGVAPAISTGCGVVPTISTGYGIAGTYGTVTGGCGVAGIY